MEIPYSIILHDICNTLKHSIFDIYMKKYVYIFRFLGVKSWTIIFRMTFDWNNVFLKLHQVFCVFSKQGSPYFFTIWMHGSTNDCGFALTRLYFIFADTLIIWFSSMPPASYSLILHSTTTIIYDLFKYSGKGVNILDYFLWCWLQRLTLNHSAFIGGTQSP